jgi:branched-chain amino acid transport system substrate-binding protein
MRELLRAVERAGSTNNIAVIKALEGLKMPAEERMQHHDAWIHPDTHQVQQTIYLATANDPAAWEKDNDDLFKIVAMEDPEASLDQESVATCKLESYEDTPTYEQ